MMWFMSYILDRKQIVTVGDGDTCIVQTHTGYNKIINILCIQCLRLYDLLMIWMKMLFWKSVLLQAKLRYSTCNQFNNKVFRHYYEMDRSLASGLGEIVIIIIEISSITDVECKSSSTRRWNIEWNNFWNKLNSFFYQIFSVSGCLGITKNPSKSCTGSAKKVCNLSAAYIYLRGCYPSCNVSEIFLRFRAADKLDAILSRLGFF